MIATPGSILHRTTDVIGWQDPFLVFRLTTLEYSGYRVKEFSSMTHTTGATPSQILQKGTLLTLKGGFWKKGVPS